MTGSYYSTWHGYSQCVKLLN